MLWPERVSVELARELDRVTEHTLRHVWGAHLESLHVLLVLVTLADVFLADGVDPQGSRGACVICNVLTQRRTPSQLVVEQLLRLAVELLS